MKSDLQNSVLQVADVSPATNSTFIGHLWAAIAATVILTVIACGAYPLLIWGIAQTVFPNQANGSLLKKDGTYTTKDDEAVGSALLGQSFVAKAYFHPRPSAAGAGYDAQASGGTNLGPLSDKLLNGIHDSKNADGTPNASADFDGVKDLIVAYRAENALATDAIVPADAVTRSGSGLDPHISPANAKIQSVRIAKLRNLDAAQLQAMVDQYTDQPGLGILGEPGVNVLRLNLALDSMHPVK